MGVLLIVGYLQWPMVKGMHSRASVAPAPAEGIAWHKDLQAALAESARIGKPVLADLSATSCPPCQAMEHDVWPDAEVGKLTNASFVPLLVDIDRDRATASRYGMEAIPMVLVLNAGGRVTHRGNSTSRLAMVAFLQGAGTPASTTNIIHGPKCYRRSAQ